MPRYLPIQADAANEEIKKVYAEVEDDLGSVPNFIKTLAHSPECLEPVAGLYRATMVGASSLGERLKELVILRTCQVDKCKATVEQHTRRALEAGVTQEQLDAMADYAASDLFNYYEKDALSLVDQVLTRPDEIPEDAFWTQLDNHFTSDQVVEMVTLISFFNMVNRLLMALSVAPDPVPAAVE